MSNHGCSGQTVELFSFGGARERIARPPTSCVPVIGSFMAHASPYSPASCVRTNDEAERRRSIDQPEADSTFLNALAASVPAYAAAV